MGARRAAKKAASRSARGFVPMPGAPASESHDELRRRYRELAEKHRKLLAKLEVQQSDATGVYRLAWWGLRATSTALALIREGRIVVANRWFAELNRALGGHREWRALPGGRHPPHGRHACLRDAIVSEARALASDPSLGCVARRYERVGADQTVEVRLDRSQGGFSDGVLAMVHDVTDQVKAENELLRTRQALFQQQRMRAVGDLASGLAHDLSNTLNAIALRMEALRGDSRSLPSKQEDIDAVSRILSDATGMVARLQDFARLRHNRPLEAVDLAAVVAEAVETALAPIQHRAARAGADIRIVRRIPPIPRVAGIAGELRRAFVNLFLNASDAMPEGGVIRVEAHQRQLGVVVTVEDEGTGIPEENLEAIFDPFFSTKGQRGTGLGLSVVYGVMSHLGGHVSAANRAAGGAIFTLTFPVARAASDAPPLSAAEREPPPSLLARRSLLLVDDDPDNLQVTKAFMEGEGQVVDVARSGAAALDKLRGGRRYDVVLCDLHMPGMSGWQVAQEIRKVAPGTPVYLLTGWGRDAMEDDPRRRLVSGVLHKPVDPERLRSLLASSDRGA